MGKRQGLRALFREEQIARFGRNSDSSNKARSENPPHVSQVKGHLKMYLFSKRPQVRWTQTAAKFLRSQSHQTFRLASYRWATLCRTGPTRLKWVLKERKGSTSVLAKPSLSQVFYSQLFINHWSREKIKSISFTENWSRSASISNTIVRQTDFHMCSACIKIHKVNRCIALIYLERSRPMAAFHSSLTDI